MKNNLQNLWVGLSFLAVGLIVGLTFNNGSVGKADLRNTVKDDSQAAEQQELEFVSVSVDDDAVLGDANAPVTIIEFSDFQCPYCARFFTDTMGSLKAEYIDKGLVKLVFRDFPLPSHTQAQLAAEAAECAGETSDEKYYEYHDMLFEKTASWSYQEDAEEKLIAYGDEIGVDIRTCLANGEQTEEVQKDYAAARGYGVSGTPTFFINGKKLVGAYPWDVIKALIDEEL
ncbi:DsbA family protein [Candidatus Peregrinibacteria bacterium]|jgi:protein-disulfide isomerase|nr:DsbA family protein [Candidatus Peregrinibacteria bacterium]MBT4631877.1 DsbA family protein [Candidatus Peregrinibacteria bacterium]MBT5516817.1 DsbA family protein [Candidatus Peregrinibacteria bacterium]MBT5824202.1 DsbA family protein [Candidatus Peregrinibacteria bacterium]